jgi:hypothetical protein
MPADKILFLDIDGVLNGHHKHPKSPYTKIIPTCVGRLNEVLLATHASIVVSSAWRYLMIRPRKGKSRKAFMTVNGFRAMLHTHGLRVFATGVDLIGHTCSDEEIPERGGQILAWLEANPGVKRWAVVDDDPMEMELGRYWRRLVRTDGKKGMQGHDVERLIHLLGRKHQ